MSIVTEAATKLLSDLLSNPKTKHLAVDIRANLREVGQRDRNIEDALVCREAADGGVLTVIALNKLLYDRAKACQALLIIKESSRQAAKVLGGK